MRFRFSLKFLLALATALALFCFWRSRPAHLAARFERSLNRADYQAADQLLHGRSPWTLQQWQTQYGPIEARFHGERQSCWQWLTGDLRGTIHVRLGDDPARAIEVDAPVIVTSSSVHLPGVTLERLDEETSVGGAH